MSANILSQKKPSTLQINTVNSGRFVVVDYLIDFTVCQFRCQVQSSYVTELFNVVELFELCC